MSLDPNLQQALEALARQQGRSVNDVLAELVRTQARSVVPQRALQAPQQQRYPVQRVEVLPPVQPRPQLQLPQRYAGVPNPQSESDLEVLARYLEAESGEQGVFGDGGMSAGGVFGDATVATAGHDPSAAGRAAQYALARMAPQLMQQLAQAARQPPQQQYPQYAPPAPVRMVTHTTQTTTYYEGPAPQQQLPPPAQAPQLPWPWGRR